MLGTVKFFNSAKGFGFITTPDGDHFAHFKSILGEGFKSLKEGDKVEFMPFKGTKGMEAKEIKVISGS